jgi:hypothetical protein
MDLARLDQRLLGVATQEDMANHHLQELGMFHLGNNFCLQA